MGVHTAREQRKRVCACALHTLRHKRKRHSAGYVKPKRDKVTQTLTMVFI